MNEAVGWIGALMLAACAWPQAFNCLRRRSASGLSLLMIILWTLGEMLQLIYSVNIRAWPIVSNCVLNLVPLSVIWIYIYVDKIGAQLVPAEEKINDFRANQ